MNELPFVRGIHLCDTLLVDEETKLVSLINCFSRRTAPFFPTPPMSFALYAMLLNGRGHVQLDLVIENRDTIEEVDRRSTTVFFQDPLRPLRFRSRYDGFSFQYPGDYELNLAADGETIASTVLRIRLEENK
jgi:hypothetical protein